MAFEEGMEIRVGVGVGVSRQCSVSSSGSQCRSSIFRAYSTIIHEASQ